MTSQPPDESPPLRFGLRSMLLAVSLVCLTAGLIRMLPLVIVVLAGAVLLQLAVFQLTLALSARCTGDAHSQLADEDSSSPES